MKRIHALLPIALAAGVATADPFFGNLDAAPVSSTLFGGAATTIFKAAGFTMGSESYDLDGVTLAISASDPDAQSSVQIWDGANEPTNFLVDLSGPLFNGAGLYFFTPDSPITLEAGETYWVFVDNIFLDTFNWESRDDVPTGVGATHLTYNFNGASSSFFNGYELEGTLATGGCNAADISSPNSPGIPDGLLTGADFFEFLARFEIGDLSVDISSPAAAGTPDGLLTGADFFFFLDLFAQGC